MGCGVLVTAPGQFRLSVLQQIIIVHAACYAGNLFCFQAAKTAAVTVNKSQLSPRVSHQL